MLIALLQQEGKKGWGGVKAYKSLETMFSGQGEAHLNPK